MPVNRIVFVQFCYKFSSNNPETYVPIILPTFVHVDHHDIILPLSFLGNQFPKIVAIQGHSYKIN